MNYRPASFSKEEAEGTLEGRPQLSKQQLETGQATYPGDCKCLNIARSKSQILVRDVEVGY